MCMAHPDQNHLLHIHSGTHHCCKNQQGRHFHQHPRQHRGDHRSHLHQYLPSRASYQRYHRATFLPYQIANRLRLRVHPSQRLKRQQGDHHQVKSLRNWPRVLFERRLYQDHNNTHTRPYTQSQRPWHFRSHSSRHLCHKIQQRYPQTCAV